MTVRVVVVEDHPVTRMGIVALLQQDEGVTVVGEAGTGEEALTVVAREAPEVVVTDLRLGDGMDGVGVTAALRSGRRAPAVLVLTTYDTDRDIVRAVEAGAAGYLLKDASQTEFFAALKQAMAGEMPLSAVVRRQLVASVATSEPVPAAPELHLTPREKELVEWVAHGLTNQQIARRMHLSEGSVKQYLSRVLGKFGVASRTQVLVRAIQLGVVDPGSLPPVAR